MSSFFEKKEGKIIGDIKGFFEELKDGYYKLEADVIDSRSERQNAFLWGIVYPEACKAYKSIGYNFNEDQVHFAFKHLFIKKKRKKNIITGRYKTIEPTTTNLSRKDFSKYIEDIRMFCIDNMNYTMDLDNDYYN